MGSRKTNARGRQLQEVINEGYFNYIDDVSTTFEKNDYEVKIDWILATQPLHSLISNVETHPTIGTLSGHKPLTFVIPIGSEPKPASPRLSLNFKAANWSKFRNKLNEQLMLWNTNLTINSEPDIEEYTSFITNSITTATQEAIPTSKKLNTNIKLSEATKHLIQLKHKTYRKWKKTGEDSEKQQYYKYKTAAIEIENILSRSFNLNSGTPQGSPLSPLLYIIYTADSMNGIPEHTEHGLFADDTALWTSSNTTTSLSFRLQQSIDAFQSWCNSWKLKLQPSKTELVHFTIHPRRKFKNPISVKIDDTIVKTSNSTRYLGVIIDKTLNWRSHLHHIESKIAGRISLLRFLNRAAYEPNDKIMLNIFKSIARSIIIYGYPILLTANDKIWERLQIMQNKAIRAALGLPIYTSVDYIHRTTNIPKIKEYAVTLLQRYIQTATSNKDVLLQNNLQDIFNKL
ncbi:unnamed protein product [Rotaria sp. Silwood2]|nr:unnamed protein product [Rotaria sp. Silwood2]CAF4304087.1 unnamed protein product [Rotaria sp. Silwood2]CAF4407998.1 unnamed protein product [Rotaria sp. Silwood2]